MAISFVGGADAAATSVTLPAHQAGDLIVIFARRSGGTTPGTGAGYTQINADTNGVDSYNCGYKLATSSSETSGTWTNAGQIIAHVLRGALDSGPIGNNDLNQGFGSSVSYGAVTLAVTDGTSWVAGFGIAASSTLALESPPSGMTLRQNRTGTSVELASFDTNAGVSSFTSRSTSLGGTADWLALAFEIKAGIIPPSGTAAITEAADTVAGTGGLKIAGTAAITEVDDSVAATGYGNRGQAAITEADDTVAGAARKMGIGFVGAAVVHNDNTITLPTHQAGDLILVFAFKTGGATIPSLPAGFTNVRGQSEGGGGSAFRLGYKIAASGAEGAGTWSNANSLVAMVHRGQAVSPIGGNSYSDGNSSSVQYPGVTLSDDDGTSWVATFAGIATNTSTVDVAPTGQVNRASAANATYGEVAGFDTNGAVTSWTGQTNGVGASASWLAVSVEIRGDLRGQGAATEGDDTVAATGLGPNAQAAITEADDSVAATGSIPLAGTASITEAGDTAAGTGVLPVAGTGAITEADDTAAGAGTITLKGSAAIAEADDAPAGAGSVTLTGSAAITEEGDTVAGEGDKEGAYLEATEADDTASGTGALAIQGAASITEADDTDAGTGTLPIAGSLTATEGDDTSSGSATVSAQGALNSTEADDVVSATGTLPLSGSLGTTEESDGLTAVGDLTAIGSLSVTEADDAIVATGLLPVKGASSITEAGDTVSAAATVTAQGAVNVTEADDNITASGTLPPLSLASPLPLSLFWDRLEIARGIVDLLEPKSKAVGGNGKVYLDFEGPARWIGSGQFAAMYHEQSMEIEALLRWLGPGRSFLAYDKRKPYPTFDPDGTKLGAATPVIADVGTDNTSIAVFGLTPNFRVTGGDLMSYERANGRRALIQAVETKTADGSGLITTIQVYPPLRSGTAIGQSLNLIKPCAEFILSPDSKAGPNGTRAVSDGMSFEFEESL